MSDVQKEKQRHETKEERRSRFKERRRIKAESKLVGFRQSTHYIDPSLTDQSIYFIDPSAPKLRKVHPYFFTWVTHAKERWYDRTIEDVFQHEFRRAILKQNFDDLIRNGLIRINGQCIQKDYVIKNGDKLEHFTHRHEVPVINQKFEILINNEDYLVIDKPCSIPVHVRILFIQPKLFINIQYILFSPVENTVSILCWLFFIMNINYRIFAQFTV